MQGVADAAEPCPPTFRSPDIILHCKISYESSERVTVILVMMTRCGRPYETSLGQLLVVL